MNECLCNRSSVDIVVFKKYGIKCLILQLHISIAPPVSLTFECVSSKMATIYENVIVSHLNEDGRKNSSSEKNCRIEMSRQGDSVVLCINDGKKMFFQRIAFKSMMFFRSLNPRRSKSTHCAHNKRIGIFTKYIDLLEIV